MDDARSGSGGGTGRPARPDGDEEATGSVDAGAAPGRTAPAGGGPLPGAPSPRAARRARGCLVELVQTVVLTLLIFFGIQAFVAQPFQVKLFSMQQTFQPGDYVLVDKLTPRWDSYGRGDVVVFDPPPSWTTDPTPFIKRVIGEPGDTVEVRDDGLVYVNGTRLDEPYLFRDADGEPEPTLVAGAEASWVVPGGELFVMGDHRMRSADSRSFGSIPVGSVLGRGAVRYWPLSSFSFVSAPVYAGMPAP